MRIRSYFRAVDSARTRILSNLAAAFQRGRVHFNNNNRMAARTQGLQRVLILFHIYLQLLCIISFLRGFITFIDRSQL